MTWNFKAGKITNGEIVLSLVDAVRIAYLANRKLEVPKYVKRNLKSDMPVWVEPPDERNKQ